MGVVATTRSRNQAPVPYHMINRHWYGQDHTLSIIGIGKSRPRLTWKISRYLRNNSRGECPSRRRHSRLKIERSALYTRQPLRTGHRPNVLACRDCGR